MLIKQVIKMLPATDKKTKFWVFNHPNLIIFSSVLAVGSILFVYFGVYFLFTKSFEFLFFAISQLIVAIWAAYYLLRITGDEK